MKMHFGYITHVPLECHTDILNREVGIGGDRRVWQIRQPYFYRGGIMPKTLLITYYPWILKPSYGFA